MKRFLILLILINLAACAGTITDTGSDTDDGDITEVGNPTTPKAIASALTKADENSFGVLADTVVDTISPSVGSFLVTSTDDFECEFDADTLTQTCTCPGGGTIAHDLDADFARSGFTLSLDAGIATVFDACSITTCDTEIILDGNLTGDGTATIAILTLDATLNVTRQTETACTGITANDSDVGLDMDFSFADATPGFSGTLCIDDTIYTFGTTEELREAVDPEESCEDF